MASANPARLLGIADRKGAIAGWARRRPGDPRRGAALPRDDGRGRVGRGPPRGRLTGRLSFPAGSRGSPSAARPISPYHMSRSCRLRCAVATAMSRKIRARALAVSRHRRANGLEQVVVDHVPAHQQHLAGDPGDQHVVAVGVVDPVLDISPAQLHVPVGRLVQRGLGGGDVGQRPAVEALVLAVLDPRRERRQPGRLGAHQPLVLVEHVVGGADRDRRQRDREHRHRAARRTSGCRAAASPACRRRRRCRSCCPEGPSAPGSGVWSKRMLWEPLPFSPSMSPQSSSISHCSRGATNSSIGGGAVAAGIGEHRLAHVVGRVRRARGERDLAVDLPAVAGRASAVPTGAATEPGAEVAAGEDLVLRLLRPPRADHQRVVHGQAHAPGGRHAAARDLLDDAHVGRARRTRSRRSGAARRGGRSRRRGTPGASPASSRCAARSPPDRRSAPDAARPRARSSPPR